MTSLRRSEPLAHTLESTLAQRIHQGLYPARERLPTEAALVEEFGVSRTVVREAVSRLQAAGLVATRHGIGTFVCEPANATSFKVDPHTLHTLHDVVSVLEVRLAIETEAASLAAQRRTPAQLALMEQALVGFSQALRQGADTVEFDLQFHQAIAEATQNPRFQALLAAMGRGAIPRARLQPQADVAVPHPHYLQQIHREHRAVLRAIAAQDAEQARKAMRRHLTHSRDRRLEQSRANLGTSSQETP